MWLYSNVEKCKSVETGTRMFMLVFIGSLLSPDLGSIVSLHYLWSLRDIRRINNYDWGGMAYATILHFITQLSKCSLSSLGGVGLDVYVFQGWMSKYFRVGPQLLEVFVDEVPRFICWIPKNCLSTLLKCSLKAWKMAIDSLDIGDVSFLFSFIGGSLI